MDPALEESAMMSGANISVAYRITLRLSWPRSRHVLIPSSGDRAFECPQLLGLPVGIKVLT